MENNNHPIVFISYARTNSQHVERIVNFANKLRDHGIDAKLDEWDLKVGHDINHFMEEKIKSEAEYVLLILNKEFVEKADKRKDGVGKEIQLISEEVYDDVKQEKVIPIVWERDNEGNSYLPRFLKSRYFIDLSSEEKMGENYELLLRTLYDKPKNPKSELGEMPKWLDNTNHTYPKTSNILSNFNYKMENHPEKLDSIIEEFFEYYYEYLKEFEIEFSDITEITIANEIYKNLEKYEILKHDLEEFLEKIFKTGKYQKFDSDILIEFLTKTYSLTKINETDKKYNRYSFVNFDFILREIFLYFIAYGLKHKNYDILGDLFYSPYYLDNAFSYNNGIYHYVNLDNRGSIPTSEILDIYYKNEKEKNFITPIGELLLKRIPHNLTKEYLIDGDLLCCYISYMNYDNFEKYDWFPFTHIHKKRYESYNLFRKLTSKKFFNSVKTMFDVDTVEEFKQKVISTRTLPLGRGEVRFSHPMFGYVKPIEEYIDLDKICSER